MNDSIESVRNEASAADTGENRDAGTVQSYQNENRSDSVSSAGAPAQNETQQDAQAEGQADPKEKQQKEAPMTAEEKLDAANKRAVAAELRAACALEGVPREKIPYVMRLADVSGIDMNAEDASARIGAAVGKVLSDLPEFRGAQGVGTGGAGNFRRGKPTENDPDLEKIKKNILG